MNSKLRDIHSDLEDINSELWDKDLAVTFLFFIPKKKNRTELQDVNLELQKSQISCNYEYNFFSQNCEKKFKLWDINSKLQEKKSQNCESQNYLSYSTVEKALP